MRKSDRRRRTESGDDALLIQQFFGDDEEHSPRRGDDRKVKQVLREVYRVLAHNVTVGEVLEVRPAPDSSRLAVAVRPWPDDDPARVLEALTRDKGRLRAEIAAALQRKRTPELVFEVLP